MGGVAQPSETKFLLNGRTLRLPGVGPGSSGPSRAEALRVFLEESLGEDRFLQAYRRMQAVTAVCPTAVTRPAVLAPRCARPLMRPPRIARGGR